MRNIFLKTTGGMALAVLLLAMFAPIWGASSDGGGGRLEGTWDVQVTLRNCNTGAEIRSFASLTTFMSGGTTLDSTSHIPQAQKTPGQGVWNHVSGNTYRISFKHFNFDSAGTFIGWNKVTQEVTLESNGTAYSSAGTAEVYDRDGNLMFTGCSTTTATRFE